MPELQKVRRTKAEVIRIFEKNYNLQNKNQLNLELMKKPLKTRLVLFSFVKDSLKIFC